MRIGVFGGTFNQPHIGHLIIAEAVKEKLKLDKVFFIPTNTPPHKNNGTIAANHRFQMVKLSIENNGCFDVLDLEIKRGGVSYTIDTLKQIKDIYPESDLFLIAGSDLANDFSSWRDFSEIKKIAEIVVVRRKDFPLKVDDNYAVVDTVNIGVSSSEIRCMVENNESVRYLLRDTVAEYIKNNNLYKERR